MHLLPIPEPLYDDLMEYGTSCLAGIIMDNGWYDQYQKRGKTGRWCDYHMASFISQKAIPTFKQALKDTGNVDAALDEVEYFLMT